MSTNLVQTLLRGAEKAGRIARLIRSEQELFQLLIEEKSDAASNPRFRQDFKTLADVLIQEYLRHEIAKLFPELSTQIYGEESNKFTSSLTGENISVTISENELETAQTLNKVLPPGHEAASKILAHEVHQEIQLDGNELNLSDLPYFDVNSDLGIWIDPIDGTNEYIRGASEENASSTNNEFPTKGLQCVTVLIGIFELSTGKPIFGIINQPFWKYDMVTSSWTGRFFWGFDFENKSGSSIISKLNSSNSDGVKKRVILSESESPTIISKLENSNYELIYSSGAGYKLLCVVEGKVDFYLLSKNSTYFWDTCGPHGVLRGLGGGILKFVPSLEALHSNGNLSEQNLQIVYHEGSNNESEKFNNLGGILAYRSYEDAIELLRTLSVS